MNAEHMEELVAVLREMAANRERTAGKYLQLAGVLAQNLIALADVAPSDPLRPLIVRGARERAERVLRELGDDEHAN